MSSLDATPRPAHLGRPHPTLVAPDGDLSQRTGEGRVMTETIPIKKQNDFAACLVCASHKDKGYLTIKDWLRKLRRENDPREPIVKAFGSKRHRASSIVSGDAAAAA